MKQQEIKREIKDLSERGRKCWIKIRATHGSLRAVAWNEKRMHGKGVRYLLLAYAYIRGRSYSSQESKNRPGSIIDVEWLAAMAETSPEAIRLWLAERVNERRFVPTQAVHILLACKQ